MLVVYNETKYPWSVTDINDHVSKASISKKTKRGSSLYLDLAGFGEIIKSMDSVEDYDVQPSTVYKGHTSVKFQRKDLKPFIGTTEYADKNTDILVLAIDMTDRVVVDIPNKGAFVLGYLFANKSLFMIVSTKPVRKNKNDKDDPIDLLEGKQFKIKLGSTTENKSYLYHFTKSDSIGGYLLTMREQEEDIKFDKPTYKISKYRPMRPTYLTFALTDDYAKLKSTYRFTDRLRVETFDSMESLDEIIQNVQSERFKVCTLFIDSKEMNPNYQPYFDILKNEFNIVNILINDGKTTLLTR